MATKKKNKKTLAKKKILKPSVKAKKSPKKKQASLVKHSVKKKLIKKAKPVAKKTKPLNTQQKVETKKTISKKEVIKSVGQETITKKLTKKEKNNLLLFPEQKPILVSSFPKHKVKTVLVSQPRPESEKSPYLELAKKFNLKLDFRQFISVEGVSSKDFRQQKINILEHNAVILTSRIAIDHYFRMANEMRLTIPESVKYFCLSESIAYYLQKYVQYRKRKIFYGHQTIQDLVDVIKKHREERFLLPVSDVHREQIVDFLDKLEVKYSKATFYRTVSSDLSDMKGKLDYDLVVFFTPAGIRSLRKNFPGLKQGSMRIAAFGYNTAQAVQQNGYRLDIHAPTPQAPSMTMALEHYIKEANKR
jgi:uroporphyrinogen-III synthase